MRLAAIAILFFYGILGIFASVLWITGDPALTLVCFFTFACGGLLVFETTMLPQLLSGYSPLLPVAIGLANLAPLLLAVVVLVRPQKSKGGERSPHS
jgi:hypothetical protein